MSALAGALPLPEVIKILPGYDPYADCEAYYFDEKRARKAIYWIENCCTLTEGSQFAGKPFILEPWQKAIVANIFGWYSKADGSRRYYEILIYVPRKNGKTELLAAIILYILFCDGETGAQIYSAASTEKQAGIVFKAAKKMIKASEIMQEHCTVYESVITHHLTDSFFQPTVASEKATHGYNAQCVVVDELHACEERVVSVLASSQTARFQPLFFYTTTADFDRPSICNKVHKRASKVRDGDIKDPGFLPVIYEADRKKDDWHDEEVWKKANPNYGVSLNVRMFKVEYQKACLEKSYENDFKRLHLNMRTEQSERWIDLVLWDKCGTMPLGHEIFRGHPDELEKFKGRPCFSGLDLSDTIDTTSLVLVFPEDDFKVITYLWIPEDSANQKEKDDKVPYNEWAEDGWIEKTPGNRIDYAFIRQKIIDVCEVVDMKEIGFDPYNATQLSIDLTENEGLPMKMVRQGFVTMNEPCKRVEADMAKGILHHGGNPVLRTHASNVMIKKDPAGNIKIDKSKSSEKVDAMAALVDAYACFIADLNEIDPYSVHGILSLGGDEDQWHGWKEEDKEASDDDLDESE